MERKLKGWSRAKKEALINNDWSAVAAYPSGERVKRKKAVADGRLWIHERFVISAASECPRTREGPRRATARRWPCPSRPLRSHLRMTD